jgi:Spy/CpxP family protein refolding chaperone
MKRARIWKMATALLFVVATGAQAADTAQTEMDIVRESIRADKKALVATNLELTEAQAKAFWPVYDRYQKDLVDVQSRLFEVIQEYAAIGDKLTDDEAKALIERYLKAEEDRAKVRRSYLAELSKAVPGRTVARFYQIENKIDAVVRYETAAAIPLVATK